MLEIDNNVDGSYRIILRYVGDKQVLCSVKDNVIAFFPGPEQPRNITAHRMVHVQRAFIHSIARYAIFFTVSGSWTTIHCIGYLCSCGSIPGDPEHNFNIPPRHMIFPETPHGWHFFRYSVLTFSGIAILDDSTFIFNRLRSIN